MLLTVRAAHPDNPKCLLENQIDKMPKAVKSKIPGYIVEEEIELQVDTKEFEVRTNILLPFL